MKENAVIARRDDPAGQKVRCTRHLDTISSFFLLVWCALECAAVSHDVLIPNWIGMGILNATKPEERSSVVIRDVLENTWK